MTSLNLNGSLITYLCCDLVVTETLDYFKQFYRLQIPYKINKHVLYILTYKSTARISRPPPQIFTPNWRKNARPSYKSTPFFRFYMEIYFVARNEASVRQFSRRSVSARSVLWSNQAATVHLRPSYRPITVSLFYRPYHRTAVWIMIKLVLSDRAVVTCLSPPSAAAWPPPTTWHMQRYLPFRRSSVCTHDWQLQHLSPSAASSAGRPRCPRLPPVRQYQVASPIPVEKQLRSIVGCSHGLASTSAVDT